MKKQKGILLALILVVLVGCDRANPFLDNTEKEAAGKPVSDTESIAIESTETEETASEATEEVKERNVDTGSIDLSLHPSEGGKIMVLMYHNIGPEEEEWVRTPENFREDLRVLYEKGYRPIRLSDYATGNITTPAGLTPYVLTFDDARENNFRYLEDGSIDPDCAVGILMDFAEEYPDFTPHATFFVNGEVPFRVEGEEEQKVAFLIENGMDIGNHSSDHGNYETYSGEDLQESIGAQANYLESIAPEGYRVNTLALPFGSRPDDSSLTHYLQSGEYEGKTYENIAILDVGWDPWYSPFHTSFDPYAIHRVRASEINVGGVGIYDWLAHFDLHPEERFISDGEPSIVSAPADWADVMKAPDGKTLYLYELQE